MEIKNWSYEEFPEFTEEVEGAGIIETTGDEVGVNYFHDVEYAVVKGTHLHLQILIPASRKSGFMPFAPEQPFSLPCFVYVQGSGWMKQYVYANLANMVKLAQKGYVCAIVEYRHSEIAYFPAQALDARNAVRFLRKNAKRFGIDPERMILAGCSSGGHTALWAGLIQDETGSLFEGVSADVCGIINYFGSTSFMAEDSNPCTANHNLPDSPEGLVMGRHNMVEEPELARQLSVECNIDKDTKLPPILIFHGTKDRTVNCTCSVAVYKRLKETGHDAQLYLIRGADHGGPEFWTDQVVDIVDAFCRRCFG